MNLIVILLSAYAAVAIAIAVMLRRAPVGYEDEAGFHRGEPPLPAPGSETGGAKF